MILEERALSASFHINNYFRDFGYKGGCLMAALFKLLTCFKQWFVLRVELRTIAIAEWSVNPKILINFRIKVINLPDRLFR